MSQVQERLAKINGYLALITNADHKKMPALNDLLRMQSEASYAQLLNGIDSALELYIEKRNGECFAKVQAMQAACARRDSGFNLLGNGFYMHQGTRGARMLDPSTAMLKDHTEFIKGYEPVMQERAMVPRRITLIHKLYGREARITTNARPGFLSQSVLCYGALRGSFFNLSDKERAFLASNFYQLDDGLKEYLLHKQLIPGPKQLDVVERPKEVLAATIEYLGHKIDARQLQRVLMSWYAGS